MSHSFVGTTLALQHYYDIVAVSRKLPLMTIYQSHEQPFGQRMAIWMANYGDEIPVAENTQKRLDEALLLNRAINDPHALRVLDYGTSEGFSFVVTDAIDDMPTLRAWLRTHEALANWQTLRLLEQLVGIIQSAHQAGFKNLCLTSDNIFIKDPTRFEIVTGPLGIGLYRSEILAIQNVPVTAALMRHIPPWEYGNQNILQNTQTTLQKETTDSENAPNTAESKQNPENTSNLNSNLTSDDDENTDAPKDPSEHLNATQGEQESPKDDSVQNLDMQSARLETALNIPTVPDGVCPDVYNLACILYEAICGQHPYFNDDRDLCDAAFSMIQATPPDISKRIEISDDINQIVMDLLKSPKPEAMTRVLNDFAACCTPEDKEKARQADKIWLTPVQSDKPKRKKQRTRAKIKYPLAWLALTLAIFIGLTATLTWHIAQYKSPVDLFALPEITPSVPNGIDVVLAPRSIPPETAVYLTSHADGRLIKLGTLPYIYRQQAPDTHLTFVIADDYGHSMQVPVTVKGENGLMLVPVDLNW